MSHFSQKSLLFYAIAIGSVTGLFSLITHYGESKLRAPALVAGEYDLRLQSTSHCPKPPEVVLVLQQSGIYLSGAILPKEEFRVSQDMPRTFLLDGQWRNQRLLLEGRSGALSLCDSVTGAIDRGEQRQDKRVTLRGTFENGGLTGAIGLGSDSESLRFTALRFKSGSGF